MHKQRSLPDLKAAAAGGGQTNTHCLAMHILFFRADHFEGRLPSREPRGNRHVIGFCAWADYQNRNEARQRRWWEPRVWGSARVFIGKHISDGTPLMAKKRGGIYSHPKLRFLCHNTHHRHYTLRFTLIATNWGHSWPPISVPKRKRSHLCRRLLSALRLTSRISQTGSWMTKPTVTRLDSTELSSSPGRGVMWAWGEVEVAL